MATPEIFWLHFLNNRSSIQNFFEISDFNLVAGGLNANTPEFLRAAVLVLQMLLAILTIVQLMMGLLLARLPVVKIVGVRPSIVVSSTALVTILHIHTYIHTYILYLNSSLSMALPPSILITVLIT